jgi:hypothetical protein
VGLVRDEGSGQDYVVGVCAMVGQSQASFWSINWRGPAYIRPQVWQW